MTKRRDPMHPRLQVPDRVWLIFYAIDGRWQRTAIRRVEP
jgi:hypothetical protein